MQNACETPNHLPQSGGPQCTALCHSAAKAVQRAHTFVRSCAFEHSDPQICETCVTNPLHHLKSGIAELLCIGKMWNHYIASSEDLLGRELCHVFWQRQSGAIMRCLQSICSRLEQSDGTTGKNVHENDSSSHFAIAPFQI